MCINNVKVKTSDKYKRYQGTLVPYGGVSMMSCGKCFECRERRIDEWTTRWHEQLKVALPGSNFLLTLTYAENKIPLLVDNNGEYKTTLNYDDVQKFIKRLRRRQEYYCKKNNIINPKIVYHGCGEYGKRFTKRPHYHILITNVLLPQNVISECWSLGRIHFGDRIDMNTIKYVLKYTLKFSYDYEQKTEIRDGSNINLQLKSFDEKVIRQYEFQDSGKLLYKVYTKGKNKNRIIEKSFCSKGIGKNFLTDENVKMYRENPAYLYALVTHEGVKSKPLPRYYRDFIFNPKIKDENGKTILVDGKPVSLWCPLSDDYEKTPRFQKQLIMFKRSQEVANDIVYKMRLIGYENILEYKNLDNQNKVSKFERWRKNYDAILKYNLELYGTAEIM